MGLHQLISKLEVSRQDGGSGNSSYSQQFLTNDDLLPVPPENRSWAAWNFVALWMIVSSMVQLGMSWWQAWICVWIGYGVVAPFIVLSARPGAVFHITFPVVARTSFGVYGSLWCVFNRGAMACIWYGVQASIGGDCVRALLRAMWPSVNDISLSENTLPASSGTTTRDFMCFFLFWLISLPAIWFPIHKIRHLFTIKAVVVPIAGITFFVWCIAKAHGVGPIIHQPAKIHGSTLSWAMVSSLMSCISNMATLVTNAPDFASRAKSPSAAGLPQLLSVPLGFSIVSFIGIIVSSSSETIYGEAIWSPVDLLEKFLDHSPSHATRFGVWFIADAFIIAQLGSVPRPVTLALFPRFINIRRGGFIAAIVGICMLPWNLLKSSNSFTSYLSAYSVFLSSIAGVMITDYWVIRKGHYRVKDLYSTRRDGWYWYTYGINFRAYAAYIAGILINVVGFAGATGRVVPVAATHIYEMSFFTGFGVSSLVYWTLNYLFPVPGASSRFEERDESTEDEEVTQDVDTKSNTGKDDSTNVSVHSISV
ncbi:hypothetical protein EIP91_002088 [Steccherinum ochraceum]|uniref:Uracil permease n=1 Tax=Steccherinum ochraceum TaxID=92696 RepID=A0A4R0RU25_9APHY|nr:hypothetical protein EIP91_002088 [Steccherinum ochraceum]